MDSRGLFFALIAAAGSAWAVWYFWFRSNRLTGVPAAVVREPEPPDVDDEEDQETAPSTPGGGEQLPRPDLDDPDVAKADALLREWFGQRLSGQRGLDSTTLKATLADLARDKNLTPGLAAMAAYDEHCRSRRLSPKRPPASVRAAMQKLGLRR